MRSYEEMADNILRKYNDQLEQKKRRSTIIKHTAVSVSGLCAAAVIGVSVWHNAALRGNLDHNTGNENIISETCTDITTTSLNGTTDSATATVTSSVETSSETGNKKISTSGNSKVTVTETTTVSTSDNSSSGKKTTKKSSGQTIVTTVKTPANRTTTSINNTDQAYNIEKNFSMKYFSAFTSGLIRESINNSSNPLFNANGTNYIKYLQDNHLTMSRVNQSDMDAISKRKSHLDFNEDGNFDMWDVYAFYRGMVDINNHGELVFNEDGTKTDIPPVYTAPNNIKNNVAKYGDFSGDNNITEFDFELLVAYYSTNYPITYDFVDPNHYYFNCPDNYINSDAEGVFDKGVKLWKIEDIDKLDLYYNRIIIFEYIDRLMTYSMRIYGGYSTFCDIAERGMINFDIDGDGEFTISDLYDIIGINYYEQFGDEDKEYALIKEKYFTEEEYKKLKNNSDICKVALSFSNECSVYFVAYYFDHNAFNKAYADSYFFDNMRGGIFKDEANCLLTDYLRYAIPGMYSPRFEFTEAEIKNDYINYCKKIKQGLLPEPDINMNGTIEFEDYIYANLLLVGDYLPDKTKYPLFDDNIIKNFRNNCDFNDNMMSGDLSDVTSVQLYIVNKLGISENEVKNEIARYFKKHPEIDVYDYEHYVLPEEE